MVLFGVNVISIMHKEVLIWSFSI